MIKLLGKDNDLRTKDGAITRKGYFVMIISAIFGLCIFLLGRYLYGRALQKDCNPK